MKRFIGVLLLLAFCVVPMTAAAFSARSTADDGGFTWPGGWPRGWARLVVD